MEWIVPIVLATAGLAPALVRALGHRAGGVLACVPAGVAIHAAIAQPRVASGAVETFRTAWLPSLGVDWAFRVDGLANLFVLLIAGIQSSSLVKGLATFESPQRADSAITASWITVGRVRNRLVAAS